MIQIRKLQITEKDRLTFSRASKPLSKKRIIARNVKKKPKPMSPNPISAKEKRRFLNYKANLILLGNLY